MRGSDTHSCWWRAKATLAVASALVLLALVPSASNGPAAAETDPTVVFKNPAAANLFLGAGPLVIAERAQAVPPGPGLGAFQIRVTYHHKFVSVSVAEGPFLGSMGAEVACVTYPSTGQVTFGCVSLAPPPGPTGSGTLANLIVQPAAGLHLRAVPGNYATVDIHNIASSTVLADTLGMPFFITSVSDSRLYVRPLESDVNVDCAVDNLDMAEVIAHYGATLGSLLYSQMLDLEPAAAPDGDIDILDVQAVSSRFGSTCGAPHPAQPPPPPPCPDGDGDLVCNKADEDGDNDGMPDKFEAGYSCLNPLVADGVGDPDADGLNSGGEQAAGTNPCVNDTDGDGLLDGTELNVVGSNPLDTDSDNDGLSDGEEVNSYGTDPLDSDSDDDALPDGDEVNLHNTDPLDADSDADELSDGDEVNSYGTDPLDSDSDDDALPDGDEVTLHGTDPLDPDSDGDGLADGDEVTLHSTDPLDADSDDDGLPDGDEVTFRSTDPLDADSDDDGLSDGDEVTLYGTDPLDADSDDDGLSDGDEVSLYLTNPLLADTENDGLPDGYEVARLGCGFNPSVDDAALDTDTDMLANALEFGMGTEPCVSDTDTDGCTDGREAQSIWGSQLSGGMRDPLSPWDYFNPSHDGRNRVDDILEVVNQYYVDQGSAAYNADTDRTFLGPYAWAVGPPNGLQRVDDILNAVKQYFHDCA